MKKKIRLMTLPYLIDTSEKDYFLKHFDDSRLDWCICWEDEENYYIAFKGFTTKKSVISFASKKGFLHKIKNI